MPDHAISALSMAEQRIVITKDEDFFDSFILQQRPYKLIFVITGNIKNRALLDLFRAEFQAILALLSKNDLIEVNNQHIKVWL